METQKKYEILDAAWANDERYKCCSEDPNDTPGGCDCCYDTWKKELKQASLQYSQVNEEAKQVSEKYKYITLERDKFKEWMDDLTKADQLSKEVCNQFQVIGSQIEKICTNSEKSVEAIGILFCMVRDLFEQIDIIQSVYFQIESCIKVLNREELPENSGIRKCLKLYLEKVEAVIKLRNELIKALMKVIRDANVLHEGICSEYGMQAVISEWIDIMHCEDDCDETDKPPIDPCKDPVKDNQEGIALCALIPILTFPICNDNYYRWVKMKYNEDVKAANEVAKELVEVNKRKEGLAACQASLTAAIAQVDPKELCK